MKMISWLKDHIRHIQRKADAPKVMGPKEGQADEAGRAIIPDGVEETADEAQHIQEKTDASKVIEPKEDQADEEGRAIIPDEVEETAEEAQQIQRETAVPKVIYRNKGQVDEDGRAIILPGTEVIGQGAFYGNKELKLVILPSSVKRIDSRAFGDCTALEQVVLQEELEKIEEKVFQGCKALKKITLPDSIKELHYDAFEKSAIETPVYSQTGQILFYCPPEYMGEVFRVPQGVRRLFGGALHELQQLKEIILPEGLEEIDRLAFWKLDQLKRITIPSTVKKIGEEAFFYCDNLEEVDLLCDVAAAEPGLAFRCPKAKFLHQGKELAFLEKLRVYGVPLLGVPIEMKLPEGDFWKRDDFIAFAQRCAQGDEAAMWAFADYFEGLGEEEYFRLASNFWRHRASQYGDPRAIAWKETWLREHPNQRIPAASTEYIGGGEGKELRMLGFLFFEPEREYSVGRADQDGVVEVSSWCGEEGPDEDGYGRTQEYDYWYLDEHLQPIPGVQYFHAYSHHDRTLACVNQFEEQHALAAKVLKERKSHIAECGNPAP